MEEKKQVLDDIQRQVEEYRGEVDSKEIELKNLNDQQFDCLHELENAESDEHFLAIAKKLKEVRVERRKLKNDIQLTEVLIEHLGEAVSGYNRLKIIQNRHVNRFKKRTDVLQEVADVKVYYLVEQAYNFFIFDSTSQFLMKGDIEECLEIVEDNAIIELKTRYEDNYSYYEKEIQSKRPLSTVRPIKYAQ